MVTVFTAINMFNYLDRGIIPVCHTRVLLFCDVGADDGGGAQGAAVQFGDFIQKSLHVDGASLYIGYLQSAFIVGYASASVAFGHLVHSYPPFKARTHARRRRRIRAHRCCRGWWWWSRS
jgi:hypothetical protein